MKCVSLCLHHKTLTPFSRFIRNGIICDCWNFDFPSYCLRWIAMSNRPLCHRVHRRYWYHWYLRCTLVSSSLCVFVSRKHLWILLRQLFHSFVKINLNGFGGLKWCSLQAKINGSRNRTSASSEVTNDSVDRNNGVNACKFLLLQFYMRLGNAFNTSKFESREIFVYWAAFMCARTRVW